MKRAPLRAFLAILCLAIAASPSVAQQSQPSAPVRDFAKFLSLASPLCQRQARFGLAS